jgi:titin
LGRLIICYEFSVPPVAPSGPLQQEQIDEHSAILSWKEPKSDGGSPVTSYIVEVYDTISDKWRMLAEQPSRSSTYQVDNLKADRQYQFRISAKNAAGISKPLEAEETFYLRKLEKPEGYIRCYGIIYEISLLHSFFR